MPFMSGLSWLALLSTESLPDLSTLSHAQPLPKRVSADWVKASLNLSQPPRSLSMRLATSPVGGPPPLGDITVQRSEERRAGQECVIPCRSSGSLYNKKKKNKYTTT